MGRSEGDGKEGRGWGGGRGMGRREGDGEEGGRGRMGRGELHVRDFKGRGFQITKIIPRV